MRRLTISIPITYDVDITPIKDIVDSRPFQRLRERKQLGMSHLIFPGARHTRYEHAIGVYSLTCERTERWVKDKAISEEEGWNICLFGLLHDIGHGPYSHAVESLCSKGHNEHGKAALASLEAEIRCCQGNPLAVYPLFALQHPLSACVSHRAFGTDKMDYLRRDALYTTNAVGFRTGDMLNHVHYIDGRMAIDAKFVTEAMQLEREYVDMHTRVYFRSPALIAQCFLKQIVAKAIECGDITPAKLQDMTDSELDEALRRSQHPDIPHMFDRLIHHKWPRTVIQLVPTSAKVIHAPNGKPKNLVRIRDDLLKIPSSLSMQEIAAHELEIARIAGIPVGSALIVPITTPERFIPDPIDVCDENGIIDNLKKLRTTHYMSMQESFVSSSAVRICVPAEDRERVASDLITKEILEYVNSCIFRC